MSFRGRHTRPKSWYPLPKQDRMSAIVDHSCRFYVQRPFISRHTDMVRGSRDPLPGGKTTYRSMRVSYVEMAMAENRNPACDQHAGS